VFKSVDLLFGAWESIHPALNDGGGLDDIQVGAFARSLAILECIQRDPDFASSIQSLSVYAHVKDVESADPTWRPSPMAASIATSTLTYLSSRDGFGVGGACNPVPTSLPLVWSVAWNPRQCRRCPRNLLHPPRTALACVSGACSYKVWPIDTTRFQAKTECIRGRPFDSA
jgi:hypothetical protein